MSKFVFIFSVLAILTGLFGCESHRDEGDVQQQQEQNPATNPGAEIGGNAEHGGSSK